MKINDVKVGEEYKATGYRLRVRVIAIDKIEVKRGYRGRDTVMVRKPLCQVLDARTGQVVQARHYAARDLEMPWAAYVSRKERDDEIERQFLAVSGRLVAALDNAGVEYFRISRSIHENGLHVYLSHEAAKRVTALVNAGREAPTDD